MKRRTDNKMEIHGYRTYTLKEYKIKFWTTGKQTEICQELRETNVKKKASSTKGI